MGYLTSGNEIVDAMGSINISGNIIPAIWYKTITKENAIKQKALTGFYIGLLQGARLVSAGCACG